MSQVTEISGPTPDMAGASWTAHPYVPSKPLKNPRHERLVQLMAQGRTQEEAYKLAGFRYDSGNASRMINAPAFQARLQILTDRRAQKVTTVCEVTTESLIAECEEVRLMAIELKQPQSVLAAIKEKGVLSGTVFQCLTVCESYLQKWRQKMAILGYASREFEQPVLQLYRRPTPGRLAPFASPIRQDKRQRRRQSRSGHRPEKKSTNRAPACFVLKLSHAAACEHRHTGRIPSGS
jgi:hypothetical protein